MLLVSLNLVNKECVPGNQRQVAIFLCAQNVIRRDHLIHAVHCAGLLLLRAPPPCFINSRFLAILSMYMYSAPSAEQYGQSVSKRCGSHLIQPKVWILVERAATLEYVL